jgi:hypothetical protein
MLARLADLIGRFLEASPSLPCPKCREPMTIRGEEPVSELPGALERHYQCERCGHRLTRPWLLATAAAD